MSESTLNTLLQKLRDDDPKIRQDACQHLGKLGDPAAIPELVKVYQADEDPFVVKAAEQSLKRFAKMAPAAGGGGSSTLRYATIGLTISLAVLVVLNILLRLGGGEEAASTPDLVTPSDRAELITQYQSLFNRTRTDTAAMKAEWGLPTGQLTCNVPLNRPQEIRLSDIDQATFPDFDFVDELNLAVFKLQTVISTWDLTCLREKGTIEQANTSNNRLNEIEAALLGIETQINEAITNPLSTLGPSPVPGATAETPAVVATATP